jgi:hypothetical protein
MARNGAEMGATVNSATNQDASEIDEDRRDEEARASLIAVDAMLRAKDNDDKDEADQRAGGRPRQHEEIIPAFHCHPSASLSATITP